MVQIRRPGELSEDIIDLRVRQSPRGSIPLSAAAMMQRKRADVMRQQELEYQRQREAELRAAVLRRLHVRRG